MHDAGVGVLTPRVSMAEKYYIRHMHITLQVYELATPGCAVHFYCVNSPGVHVHGGEPGVVLVVLEQRFVVLSRAQSELARRGLRQNKTKIVFSRQHLLSSSPPGRQERPGQTPTTTPVTAILPSPNCGLMRTPGWPFVTGDFHRGT